MINQFQSNLELRFCKIRKGTKKPFEKDWVNNPYSWEEIQEHIKQEGNYGVLCGYGGLIVLDSDDLELRNYVDKNFPETFRVRTGSGGTHDYYICKELNKKIVLQREKHYGEVQSFGSQVVGAGSLHPNGSKYNIEKDIPISTIDKELLMNLLKPFMKEVQVLENKSIEQLKNYGDSDINSLPILSIVRGNFKPHGKGEYYGENPWHGSSTGQNFWVNPFKNVGFCFRCNCGVNIATAIALNERIISNCSDKLSRDDFLKVLEIAYEKYGLKRPDKSNLIKASQSFNKLSQAEQFCKIQPLFYDETGMFWLWQQELKYWKAVDDIQVLNEINQNLQVDVISSKSRNEILNSLKQVGRKYIPNLKSENLIQFKNGLVEVHHPDSLLEPNPSYFITNPIPWEISQSSDTPNMDRIFKEWVGEERVQLLYEILAYCLIPNYPIHRIFCFIGSGMNGKSCYLTLLRKFIGEKNVTSTEMDNLLTSRFEVTRLHKKLVCQMGETDFSELKKTSVLKKLSGGDLIGFEYKGKTPFEDKNYAKILIATNNLPSTNDKTIGFYRRWLIVDFANTFNEKKDILSEIPDEEYNNLARKSIYILKDLIEKREFTSEGSIEERMEKYESKSNFLEKFYKEFTVSDFDSYITKADFYKKFVAWSKENRHREMAENSVGLQMRKLGVNDEKKYFSWMYDGRGGQAWVWSGIKWK